MEFFSTSRVHSSNILWILSTAILISNFVQRCINFSRKKKVGKKLEFMNAVRSNLARFPGLEIIYKWKNARPVTVGRYFII